MAGFADIPIRENGEDQFMDASWWNTIRTKLIEAFGTGGYVLEMAPQVIAAAGEVTIDPTAFKPMALVSGDSGAVTVSQTPFGVAHGFSGGKEVIICGDSLSEANSVTFESNDIDEGIHMNGKVVITRGVSLSLIYIASEKRFYRKERQ